MSQQFSVPAAQRTGQFVTPTITWPGPENTIFYQLDIPNQAEYENTANHCLMELVVNGIVFGSAQWDGGPQVGKGGVIDPAPSQQFNVSGLNVGDQVFVRCTVTGTYTIGLKNGLISP